LFRKFPDLLDILRVSFAGPRVFLKSFQKLASLRRISGRPLGPAKDTLRMSRRSGNFPITQDGKEASSHGKTSNKNLLEFQATEVSPNFPSKSIHSERSTSNLI
jgi:hypothetical protein